MGKIELIDSLLLILAIFGIASIGVLLIAFSQIIELLIKIEKKAKD